jgi:hypothetical protein
MCLSRDAGFEGRGVAETAEAPLASPYTTMKLAAQAECFFFLILLHTHEAEQLQLAPLWMTLKLGSSFDILQKFYPVTSQKKTAVRAALDSSQLLFQHLPLP